MLNIPVNITDVCHHRSFAALLRFQFSHCCLHEDVIGGVWIFCYFITFISEIKSVILPSQLLEFRSNCVLTITITLLMNKLVFWWFKKSLVGRCSRGKCHITSIWRQTCFLQVRGLCIRLCKPTPYLYHNNGYFMYFKWLF